MGSGQDPRLSLGPHVGLAGMLRPLVERRLAAWGVTEMVGHVV